MAVDSSTSQVLSAAAAETDGGLRAGGAEKTGTACLIRTGGTTPLGRRCITWAAGGGSGGAEKTGTAVLIVTGGAIPW